MTPEQVTAETETPSLRRILIRGARGRCPSCGRGPLFLKWVSLRSNCPECGLRYLENQGDPWFFQLLIDRGLFILPVVAALFFRLHRTNVPLFIVFCLANVAVFFYTTPHRYGICVGLDYYSRLRLGGQGDDEPAKPPRGS